MPVAASKISAESRSVKPFVPPTIKTLPFRSVVAVCPARPVSNSGPAEMVFVAGSKRSVLPDGATPPKEPPAINTRPSERTAAAWPARGMESVPAKLNAPVEGSNSSILWLIRPAVSPPASTTRPSGNNEAVWPARGSISDAGIVDHEFVAAS